MGGYVSNEGYSNNTFIYEFDGQSGQWIEGPKMLQKRALFGCGNFYSDLHQKSMVVVLGGYDGHHFLNTSELFDSQTLSWTSGTYIPSK